MVGCATVDRRDWADPQNVLQIQLDKAGHPGVGIIMKFASPEAAGAYWEAITTQLKACPAQASDTLPGITQVSASPGRWVGRRSIDEGLGPQQWAEFIVQRGDMLRLWLLQDEGTMSAVQMEQMATGLAG